MKKGNGAYSDAIINLTRSFIFYNFFEQLNFMSHLNFNKVTKPENVFDVFNVDYFAASIIFFLKQFEISLRMGKLESLRSEITKIKLFSYIFF